MLVLPHQKLIIFNLFCKKFLFLPRTHFPKPFEQNKLIYRSHQRDAGCSRHSVIMAFSQRTLVNRWFSLALSRIRVDFKYAKYPGSVVRRCERKS